MYEQKMQYVFKIPIQHKSQQEKALGTEQGLWSVKVSSAQQRCR